MGKCISAAEAAGFVTDGATLAVSGFNGFGCPEDLLMTLAEQYDWTGIPKNVTLVKGASQGDSQGRGISRLAEKPGLFTTLILSHLGCDPGLQKLVREEKAACYLLPLGSLMALLRAMAAGLPGAVVRTGLGTFADPRGGGGKANQQARDAGREIVSLVELGGQTCLFYPTFPIDVCFLRATYGDEDGNLSLQGEAMALEQFELAAAVHNSGGVVIAQVDQVVRAGSLPAHQVHIHGSLVDYLVEGRPEYSHQSFKTDLFRPELTGQTVVPLRPPAPQAMGPRKICCRRAAMELRQGMLLHLGMGMPGGIQAVAQEEGLDTLFTPAQESGVLGGLPLTGLDYGAAVNPAAQYRMADLLTLYAGGALDLAVLGFGEVDQYGNVNAHTLGGRLVGPGAFPDAAEHASKVCFIGTFTAGRQEVGLKGEGLVIHKQGSKKKFLSQVEGITFSGPQALARNQEVLYITERAVFRLERAGLTLIEIAHGVDLEKDILDQMDFRPVLPEYIRYMDPRLFREGPMGLTEEQMEQLMPEYEFWRDMPSGKGGQEREGAKE